MKNYFMAPGFIDPKYLMKRRKTISRVTAKLNKRLPTEIPIMICNFLDVDMDAFFSKTRRRECVTARQIASYLLRKNTTLSLSDIGGHIGGKDHATVLYACKNVENLMEVDFKYKSIVESIENELKERVNQIKYNHDQGNKETETLSDGNTNEISID